MIIVSQDREEIVNFDNIEDIWINNPLENDEGEFEIRAESCSYNNIIGEYKTEKRAKEVIEEIIKQYENSMWKLSRNTISFCEEFVYRMPED